MIIFIIFFLFLFYIFYIIQKYNFEKKYILFEKEKYKKWTNYDDFKIGVYGVSREDATRENFNLTDNTSMIMIDSQVDIWDGSDFTKEFYSKFYSTRDVIEKYNINHSSRAIEPYLVIGDGDVINAFNSGKLTDFQNNLILFCKENGLGGIVLDFEKDAVNVQVDRWKWAIELGEKLNSILFPDNTTLELHCNGWFNWEGMVSIGWTPDIVKRLIPLLTSIQLMTYNNSHPPNLTFSEYTIKYIQNLILEYEKNNIPSNKLMIGIPTYYFGWEDISNNVKNINKCSIQPYSYQLNPNTCPGIGEKGKGIKWNVDGFIQDHAGRANVDIVDSVKNDVIQIKTSINGVNYIDSYTYNPHSKIFTTFMDDDSIKSRVLLAMTMNCKGVFTFRMAYDKSLKNGGQEIASMLANF